MPQQGPELPPHLAKRKRSVDDAEAPNSPPRKVQAATAPSIVGPALPSSKNPDEVDLDDSSEDDYGPAVPQPNKPTEGPSTSPRIQGPAPPPKNPDELDVEDSSEDDYGPAPQKTARDAPAPPPKRVMGPSLPPADLSTMPSHPADASDSDSDDDYGPALPPAPGSLAAQQLQEQQRAAASVLAASSSSSADASKQRRDDWMLVPPSQDSSARADPTQLKARKFASSRGGGAPPASKGISAIWTETPEEKRRRLEDEVLGRVDAATASSTSASGPSRKDAREDAETERRIREYNERNRGRSLYEEHNNKEKGAGQEKEDDPSKRAFDREKDMALSGRLGHGQKKEMLAKAADFGSRFQKGKYL